MSETMIAPQADPAAAAAAAPAPDARAWLPEAFRADPAFAGFDTPEKLAKSFKDTQAFVGADKNDLLRLPKDGTVPPEVWNRLGRPEKAEAYTFPEGHGLPDDTVAAARAAFHAAGLPQKQAEAVVGFYAQQQEQARVALRTSTEAELKREWGVAYDQKIQAVRALAQMEGGKEFMEYAETSGLGSHPAMLKFLDKVATMTAEPGALKGGGANVGGAMTPDQAKAARDAKMLDPEFRKAWLDSDHMGHTGAVAEMNRLAQMAFAGA